AQANQIQLGVAESAAPPSNQVGTVAGPDVSAVPLVIPGLLKTGVLHGYASTSYNGTFCPVGRPLAYGLGSAAAPTSVLTSVVNSPGAAASSTRSDLIANSDGTFGMATTVEEVIAPLLVTLIGGATPTTLEIDVQATSVTTPVTLQAITDGKGHSRMVLSNADPSVTVKLTLAGVPIAPITASLAALAPLLNNLVGPASGLHTLLMTLGLNLSVALGDGVTVASPLPSFANGTNTVSGSYDLLALHLSLGTTTIADLRLGHMEAAVTLPDGSLTCLVPIAKNANPATVTAGSPFTWNISVPSTATALSDSSCDLINIKVVDKISINQGSPTFTVGNINHGGVYDPATKTVTWANIGNYHPGDPPTVLTIEVSTSAGSAAGVLQDTANATASLGNCTGGVAGIATLIGPNVGNVIVGGSVTLVAPAITAAGGPGLAATGTGPLLPWIAAGLLIVAEATRRLLRRARTR
ncbi:MAG: hypothetical protein M3083_22080, partial [Actinomycetota bacterium]|nr:hypothetical protein [Actinomycetota bacterium]